MPQEEAAERLNTKPLPLSEEALEDWLLLAPENDRALFMLAAAVPSGCARVLDVGAGVGTAGLCLARRDGSATAPPTHERDDRPDAPAASADVPPIYRAR